MGTGTIIGRLLGGALVTVTALAILLSVGTAAAREPSNCRELFQSLCDCDVFDAAGKTGADSMVEALHSWCLQESNNAAYPFSLVGPFAKCFDLGGHDCKKVKSCVAKIDAYETIREGRLDCRLARTLPVAGYPGLFQSAGGQTSPSPEYVGRCVKVIHGAVLKVLTSAEAKPFISSLKLPENSILVSVTDMSQMEMSARLLGFATPELGVPIKKSAAARSVEITGFFIGESPALEAAKFAGYFEMTSIQPE
jgi:hypothetical protein